MAAPHSTDQMTKTLRKRDRWPRARAAFDDGVRAGGADGGGIERSCAANQASNWPSMIASHAQPAGQRFRSCSIA